MTVRLSPATRVSALVIDATGFKMSPLPVVSFPSTWLTWISWS